MSFVKESIKDLDSDKAEKISYHEEEAKHHFQQAIQHRIEQDFHSKKYYENHVAILHLRNNFDTEGNHV
jgi:hypothetical protein